MRGSRHNKIHPCGNPAIVRSMPAVFPQQSYPHPWETASTAPFYIFSKLVFCQRSRPKAVVHYWLFTCIFIRNCSRDATLRCYFQYQHICTHTRLTALFSGTTQVSRYRKVIPIWILLKQETLSGSGISWAIRKSATRSTQITTPAPPPLSFYRPDALPDTQPTVSKHWRQFLLLFQYQHREITTGQSPRRGRPVLADCCGVRSVHRVAPAVHDSRCMCECARLRPVRRYCWGCCCCSNDETPHPRTRTLGLSISLHTVSQPHELEQEWKLLI